MRRRPIRSRRIRQRIHRRLWRTEYNLPDPPTVAYGLSRLCGIPSHHTPNGSHLPLAPISSSRVQYARLTALAEEINFPDIDVLHDMILALHDELRFLQLFTAPSLATDPKVRTSRLPPERIEEAVRYGVLRALSRSEHPGRWHRLMCTPKGDNADEARLLMNCHDLTEDMDIPWPCDLPDITVLVKAMAKFKYMIPLDARSWFYQLPLGRKIQRFFCCKGSAGGPMALQVLPQGWGASPAIAQLIMNVLTYRLHPLVTVVVYIDNVILLSDDSAALTEALTTLMHRAQRVPVDFKPFDQTPRQTDEVFNVMFDLKNHRWRVSETFLTKLDTSMKAFKAAHDLQPPRVFPIRALWRLIGSIMYVTRTNDYILGEAMWATLQFTSATTRILHDQHHQDFQAIWSSSLRLPRHVLEELETLVTRMCRYPWNSHPPSPPTDATLTAITDASLTGGGGIYWGNHQTWATTSAFAWPLEWDTTAIGMPVLEARALQRVLLSAHQDHPPPLSMVTIYIDCLPVALALRKGYSPRPRLNVVIVSLRKLLCSWAQHYQVLWVPTAANLADELSRILWPVEQSASEASSCCVTHAIQIPPLPNGVPVCQV